MIFALESELVLSSPLLAKVGWARYRNESLPICSPVAADSHFLIGGFGSRIRR
jgi:hypothetical protein